MRDTERKKRKNRREHVVQYLIQPSISVVSGRDRKGHIGWISSFATTHIAKKSCEAASKEKTLWEKDSGWRKKKHVNEKNEWTKFKRYQNKVWKTEWTNAWKGKVNYHIRNESNITRKQTIRCRLSVFGRERKERFANPWLVFVSVCCALIQKRRKTVVFNHCVVKTKSTERYYYRERKSNTFFLLLLREQLLDSAAEYVNKDTLPVS